MRDTHWIRSLADLPISTRWAAATIGSFDGVHQGHISLVEQLRVISAEHQGEVVVITFHPHPLEILANAYAPKLITTYRRRAELLFSAGVDWVIDLPFEDVRMLDAVDFVRQVLVDGLGVKHVLAGPDLRFGYGRSGSGALLRELAPKFGFSAQIASALCSGEARISSTRVREAVSTEGDVVEARRLLGRPHRVTGRVVHGAKRGREIGFPTANIDPETPLIPLPGIYAARAVCESGARYAAAVSVGHNPTFGTHALTVEAYLLDFEGDLYEQELSLDFLERLRGEVAFDSVDALIEQMNMDVQATRELVEQET